MDLIPNPNTLKEMNPAPVEGAVGLSCCPVELWEEVGNWEPSLHMPAKWAGKPTTMCMTSNGAWPYTNIPSINMAAVSLCLQIWKTSLLWPIWTQDHAERETLGNVVFSLTMLIIKSHHNCCLARQKVSYVYHIMLTAYRVPLLGQVKAKNLKFLIKVYEGFTWKIFLMFQHWTLSTMFSRVRHSWQLTFSLYLFVLENKCLPHHCCKRQAKLLKNKYI